MPWITQNVSGTKNGINTVFSISRTPLLNCVFVVHSGRTLFRVALNPQPGQFQFGISGNTVVVGDPPDSGDAFWTTYFYEGLPITEGTYFAQYYWHTDYWHADYWAE